MNSAYLNCRIELINSLFAKNKTTAYNLKFSSKIEKILLKVFLLVGLRKLICELFNNKMACDLNNSSMEYYAMDSKIIQFLIQDILDTGEYTLEGIAYHTHIPFDVVYEAACGISNQLSITPWAQIIELYLEVKPHVTQILVDKLLEIRKKHTGAASLLHCI